MSITKEEFETALNVVKEYQKQLLEEYLEINLATKEVIKKNPFIEIDELDISVRCHNALRGNKIRLLADVLKYSESELTKLRNFGQRSLDEIKCVLFDYGYKLRKE